jgi:hypothetical protein
MALSAAAILILGSSLASQAQEAPLLSGGVGFVTNTTGGQTIYIPVAEPLAAVPLGQHLLVESRASLFEFFAPSQKGYQHSHFIALAYLQGDVIASRHLTIVGGSYLLPFGTYNERLTPIWIGNFQDEPLMEPLGLAGGGAGLGGQLRGSLISRPSYSFGYAAWFSGRSANSQFQADRSAGFRGSFYFPEHRLEVGASYERLLQGLHENFLGTHLWWQTKDAGLRFRSEAARGQHAYGYWFEVDSRPFAFGNLESLSGRFEPVFRMQQTFRIDSLASDGLPSVNTQRADFGFDYNLPHNTRILTSYSRQFSAAGNYNIWETGIVYRFLFPAWKGRP